MNLNEFESQTRFTLEQTLNQLQTAMLMVAQLEVQLSEAGRTIQTLSQQIEEFAAQQRRSPNGD
jgi:exonuclease VII small subunit